YTGTWTRANSSAVIATAAGAPYLIARAYRNRRKNASSATAARTFRIAAVAMAPFAGGSVEPDETPASHTAPTPIATTAAGCSAGRFLGAAAAIDPTEARPIAANINACNASEGRTSQTRDAS